jgi:hypothetical protein
MDAPEKRHVRIWRDEIYIERVPSAWVMVCTKPEWDALTEIDRNFLISRALQKGLDFELPKHSQTSDQSE